MIGCLAVASLPAGSSNDCMMPSLHTYGWLEYNVCTKFDFNMSINKNLNKNSRIK